MRKEDTSLCFMYESHVAESSAMSLLTRLLVLLALELLAQSSNAECSLGNVRDNTRWIDSEGRLKHFNYNNSNTFNRDNDDDGSRLEASCSEHPDYEDDEYNSLCNCIFYNSKFNSDQFTYC
ncbi:hypothetical protein ANN_04972 [Periplaneta americana]|uniref:Uncharacterized protein n=1 Tax=Periplaneta americana TaxID=6978 RepID=A0ABQ8T9Y0_PERAM|nr:hypothetical protein ANN_04972 [Periplaneta americana]